jgi:hypothetical protein
MNGEFDLVIAWGFLHRITDVFALVHSLREKTSALSLEWRTPLLPLGSRLSLSYHSPYGDSLDPANLGAIADDAERWAAMGAKSMNTGFWEPTPGAMKIICGRWGYGHSTLLGYGDDLHSGSRAIISGWFRHLAGKLTGRERLNQLPIGRVHMMFERSPGSIEIAAPVYPDWDLALKRALGEK